MDITLTSPLPDLARALQEAIRGEVRFDEPTRILYSTDASIYQVEPLGVAFPRAPEELAACVEIAASFGVPVLARGSGSSLAGQAIGPALILDCSRHLHRQVEIDAEAGTALVEAGVILASLNRAAAAHGLQFGPDPASAERATLAGSLANNAAGAHSILYGMAADHLISAEVVLSDGTLATFEPLAIEQARLRAGAGDGSLEASLYRAALAIREQYGEAIRASWPRTWRRASGYNLNYLLPWSPAQPPFWPGAGNLCGEDLSQGNCPYPPLKPGQINLAPLLAGSEGTLAVIRRATVRLVPTPRHTLLAMLPFASLAEACEAVPALMEAHPSAIELIPANLIRLARSAPAYARQLSFLDDLLHGEIPAATLVVEFAGEDPGRLKERALRLGRETLLAETAEQQRQVWGVRKVGLGLLMSRPGDPKPAPFIEDLSVPVEQLGLFVREMERILAEHGTHGDFYAHASAGCLHLRPLVDLKTYSGVAALRSIASQAVDLVIRLQGAPSGEHGDGLARSEWLERAFGPQVVAAFRLLKQAADPRGLLNPGKILDSPPMEANLRYGPDYRASAWSPVLSFSRQAGLAGAIEQCNGAGVCRKEDGLMCPSFQATGEEMHSTRGRANLLRAMISGRLPPGAATEEALHQALQLCLACKGCQSECPSGVDMARLKYEFLEHYYRPAAGRRRPLRDYLFGYVGLWARAAQPFAPALNFLFRQATFARLGEHLLGLARPRRYPELSSVSLHAALRSLDESAFSPDSSGPGAKSAAQESVLFLSDAFTEYFQPHVSAGLAAVRALRSAGCRARVLPVVGAGRTLLSKGFLNAARRHAARVVAAARALDPQGEAAVVGVEPSEIYALRDELPDLLPGDEYAERLARRAYMIDEFLVRPGTDGRPRLERVLETDGRAGARPAGGRRVWLHGHCYQKAQPPAEDGFPTGVAATQAMLEACGYRVSPIESGCCGMAGAFGYEAEHYELSMKVGELGLFPAVRRSPPQELLAAAGVSCQAQIEDGAGRRALHPILLLAGNGLPKAEERR